MKSARVYRDFTAQGLNVMALMNLYAALETGGLENRNLTPFVVFLAFSIESYLNTLGARSIEFWDEIEKISWKRKIEILHKKVAKTADWGKEPLQFATEVFRLRDKLAHGKPERVLGPKDGARIRGNEFVPEWYKGITRDWVLEAKDRFHELMIYLGALFDFDESDHLLIARSGAISDESGNL